MSLYHCILFGFVLCTQICTICFDMYQSSASVQLQPCSSERCWLMLSYPTRSAFGIRSGHAADVHLISGKPLGCMTTALRGRDVASITLLASIPPSPMSWWFCRASGSVLCHFHAESESESDLGGWAVPAAILGPRARTPRLQSKRVVSAAAKQFTYVAPFCAFRPP